MSLFFQYLESKDFKFLSDKKYNYKVAQFTYLSKEWNNEII